MPYLLNSGENLLLKFSLIDLPAGVTWKGLWSSTTAYVVNDAVLGTDNNGYKCILAHTNHVPPNATYWVLMATIPAVEIDSVVTELVASTGKVVVTYTYSRGLRQTAGLLTIGQRYIITDFNTGDDFSNVGATNATGNVFTATGTTPTTWTNGSTLQVVTNPLNITLVDGLLCVELLKADTKPLDGDYELRTTISFNNSIYIQSGAQTDVLCLPDALTITPC